MSTALATLFLSVIIFFNPFWFFSVQGPVLKKKKKKKKATPMLGIVFVLSSWPVFHFGMSNVPRLILAFSRLYNFAYHF